LAVLRQVDSPEPNHPQPGCADLDALAAGASAAGLPTTIDITGVPPLPIPPAVDLAAYRIVQESLTNSIRHAGPATATVRVSYDDGEVCLQIADTGRATKPHNGATGHGLIGMRERALAVGGTLNVSQPTAGGFQITARLPLGPTR
jgi:signal transduction histidine kinase